MALKSTVFKANLQIADIDHGYYADHALTLARHPSETDERMMIRLVALALQAHRLQTELGWQPRTDWRSGIARLMDWLVDERVATRTAQRAVA